LTQPAATGADGRRPLVVVVAARVDTVALMLARGCIRALEVPTVADVGGSVVGAADVATASCDADCPNPIALGRVTSRPTRLAAQATTVSARPDSGGRRNPARQACLPAPAPAAR